MTDKICRWTKLIDWFEVCTEEYEKEELGSPLGWFLCVMQCSNFNGGMSYDWYKDKCVCHGDYTPPFWKKFK